ncbi:dolichyl-phosphate beta-glucosyltransferase [Streptomyces odontomachi]|uniref:dolichyl-phosphate beta-glucosyltransferase n=1 Tax=Streptomyces odontomachi TaxID=2944940 RepID=UPI00210C26ED|nr:dolichyl-phosphate beta-glucosyltransferase [Streptomyces sp. ODS25]
MSAVDLTVVVPAYDEEGRLGPTLEAICAYLRGDGAAGGSEEAGVGAGGADGRRPSHAPGPWGEWELIVVDDGSTDRTRRIAAEAAAREPRIHLVTGDRNRGKGHALRQGVLASYGRRVLVTDADLATPIEELDALDKALDDGHAAAIGSRAMPGARIDAHQHPLRELLGRTGNYLIRGVAVPGIRDTQCGFKLFDGEAAREAFAASRLTGWGIDVEILRHLRRTGRRVAEVPVRWAHQDGSKVRALDYLKVLAELTALRTRPLRNAVRAVRPADVVAVVLFLAASFALNWGRWSGGGPSGRYLPDSLQDQNQWEWFFAVTADHVAHLHDPLFTTLQGYPDGVNLMANTAMLGLSVPCAPLTWLLGPAVTLSLVMTVGLAATAAAWYRLILRRIAPGRPAATVGALLAAFAPPMVSHANAHPNFVVLFMIPPIIERVLRLAEDGTDRAVRHGAVLGLYVAYQIFLGEEPLLLAAIGLVLFLAAYGAVRRDAARAAWRPLVYGLLVSVAVCLPLVVYPLHWQFFGPQSYGGMLHGKRSANSPLALLSFAERSLAGDAATAARLADNPTEQNAFYGWPLVSLAFAITLRWWRRPAVRALAVTALLAAVLSLGVRIPVPFTHATLPGPWRLVAHLPLFESVIESRMAMVCAPALGMMVAVAVQGLLGTGTEQAGARLRGVPRGRVLRVTLRTFLRASLRAVRRAPLRTVLRIAGLAAVAAALLPIVPRPLKAVDRAPVPAFIADGTWSVYLPDPDTRTGETLVPVPLPDPGNAEGLHWQTIAHLGFSLPGGYFNGPYGLDRVGIYGAPPRWTSLLLRQVSGTGRVPEIDAVWRARAKADLAFWKAGLVVLPPQRNDVALRRVLRELLGRPGTWVDGVWIWDLHGPAGTRGRKTRDAGT